MLNKPCNALRDLTLPISSASWLITASPRWSFQMEIHQWLSCLKILAHAVASFFLITLPPPTLSTSTQLMPSHYKLSAETPPSSERSHNPWCNLNHSCSAARLCPTLCDPMDRSTLGFSVLYYLPEFAQIHVHWIGDAIYLILRCPLLSLFIIS